MWLSTLLVFMFGCRWVCRLCSFSLSVNRLTLVARVWFSVNLCTLFVRVWFLANLSTFYRVFSCLKICLLRWPEFGRWICLLFPPHGSEGWLSRFGPLFLRACSIAQHHRGCRIFYIRCGKPIHERCFVLCYWSNAVFIYQAEAFDRIANPLNCLAVIFS